MIITWLLILSIQGDVVYKSYGASLEFNTHKECRTNGKRLVTSLTKNYNEDTWLQSTKQSVKYVCLSITRNKINKSYK